MNAPVKSMPSFGEATRLFIEAGISEKALIPIAPPGAEISAKGSLSPKSLGKAPGRYLPRDKVWCGLGENSDGARYIAEGATAQDIHERASWPTRNAGLLGRYFPAIDSDASSDDARKLVEDALVRVFRDDAPYVAERIRGAGPRRLYALRCADPDDPKTWVKSGSFRYRLPRDPEGEFPHGLDVIGHGKQFVATGVHPSGDLYRWRKGYDLCELHQDDELACAADADMADFRAALVEAVEAAGGEVQQGTHGGGGGDRRDYTTDEPAMPVEAIFRGLERVPNTEANFPTHDSFVAVLAKILAALGCEAEAERDRVEEWACEDLELCPLEYFERTWVSFRCGVSEKRHALEMLFRDKRIFPNLENEFPALTENEKDGLAAVTKPFREKQDALLSEFAERYVLSRANAAADEKVPTIRRRDDPDNAVVALNWWQSRTDDLNVQLVQKLRTCGQYTPDEGGLWNFIRDIRKTRPEIMFTGTTLDPNFERGEIVIERNPDDSVTRKLNMRYQSPVIRCAKNPPQNLEQAQADLKTVLEFIRRLIGPDAEYELDTLAHMVQTGKRPGNLLFIVGDPGVGKSTYVLLLRAMFDGIGRNHGGQIDGTKLVAESSRRFALAGIEGCRIISVRELPEGASPAAMAQITSLLKQSVDISGDADFVLIEGKGKDIRPVANHGRWVLASNHENALRVEQNDRRIFFVRCNITTQERPADSYYERIAEIIETPARLATFWRYLRDERDVRGYNPAKAPPVSDAKLEAQIIAMENPAERHAAAVIADLKAAGREMLDLAELAGFMSDMGENEYRNTNGAVDDRGTYNFRAPRGPEQAALRYLARHAVKLVRIKTDDGKKHVPTIYVFTGAEAAKRLTGASGREVRDALERDRARHPLNTPHPLRRFVDGPQGEGNGDGW